MQRSDAISGLAAFLEAAFKEHGPPLFFKRDNGSPFNCCEVDQVLARHWVLPLNSQFNWRPASIISIIGLAAASRAERLVNASMTRRSVWNSRSKPANSFSGCAVCAIARPLEQWNPVLAAEPNSSKMQKAQMQNAEL
jgi:hypothetical protein